MTEYGKPAYRFSCNEIPFLFVKTNNQKTAYRSFLAAWATFCLIINL